VAKRCVVYFVSNLLATRSDCNTFLYYPYSHHKCNAIFLSTCFLVSEQFCVCVWILLNLNIGSAKSTICIAHRCWHEEAWWTMPWCHLYLLLTIKTSSIKSWKLQQFWFSFCENSFRNKNLLWALIFCWCYELHSQLWSKCFLTSFLAMNRLFSLTILEHKVSEGLSTSL